MSRVQSFRPALHMPDIPAAIAEVDFDTPLPTSLTVRDVIDKLLLLGLSYRVVNNGSQIKIGRVNFYPTRGSVLIDGQKKFKETGFDFLLEVLRREGYRV